MAEATNDGVLACLSVGVCVCARELARVCAGPRGLLARDEGRRPRRARGEAASIVYVHDARARAGARGARGEWRVGEAWHVRARGYKTHSTPV